MRRVSTDDLEVGMVVMPAHLDPEEHPTMWRSVWRKEPYWPERLGGEMKWEVGYGNSLNGWWSGEEWWVAPDDMKFVYYPAWREQ